MSEPEEHRAIWLEPRCTDEIGEDRCWSQSDAWVTCEECGLPSVKYIIATEYDVLMKALAASQGYLMNAKIDLETGAPKATAIRTIEGGLNMIKVALAKVES
jgi:hypothetical protein